MSEAVKEQKPGKNYLRPLGPTEDMYWRFDSLSPINFGTIVRFSGEYERDKFRLAIDAVQARHPLLRVCIETDEKEVPWFVYMDNKIPVNYLEQPEGEEWHLLEHSLATEFDSTEGPLLRCILVKHSDSDFSFITTYHHAISDGRSATFLTRDLLQSLAQQEKGDSPDLVPMTPMDYYGDRIHTLRSYSNLKELLDTAWRTWKAALRFVSRVGFPKGLPKKGEVPLNKQTLLVEPRFMEPEMTARVAKKAKQEGATMQCVLNAALSMAVSEITHPTGLEKTACSQVLDVRERLIPPVGEDCGLFASGNTSMHSINEETDFWELARDIRVGLQESLDTPLPFFHPATHSGYSLIARGLGESGSRVFSKFISSIHPEGICVSNLGMVKIEVPESPVQVESFAFATNTNVLNYFNTSAATYNGRMTWSFSASSIVGREKLIQVADRTIELIIQALDQ